MLTLSTSDQKRLKAAHRELLSPLEHGDVDAWRGRVSRACRNLLKADVASFALPMAGRLDMYSEGFDDSVRKAFPTLLPNLSSLSIWKRQVELGVWSRARIYGRRLPEYYRTDYYREYIIPARAFDSIGVTIPLASNVESHTTAALLFHHDHDDGPQFGERGLDLLSLLKPSFQAGVETHFRLAHYRSNLTRVIDSIDEAVLLLNEHARDIHRTPTLERLLSDDCDREIVMDAARSMGRDALIASSSEDLPLHAPRRSIQTRKAQYDLTASWAGRAFRGAGAMVVVTLRRAKKQPLDPAGLRTRFGLTRRQAEVALLLAEGRSNDAIACALFISPHTARHHTEQVMSKLRVHARAEIMCVLKTDP